jgi:hypothetical protein
MRHVMTLLLVVAHMSSTALAFQAPTGAPASGKACALLTRELLMKVLTAQGQKIVEAETPSASAEGMSVAKRASVCSHGPVTLVLEPSERPDQVRNQMRTRAPIYKDHEPVPGVGDDAFFNASRTFAYLYVWSGSHHFMIEMGGIPLEDARTMKPNVIALAKALVSQIR